MLGSTISNIIYNNYCVIANIEEKLFLLPKNITKNTKIYEHTESCIRGEYFHCDLKSGIMEFL